MNTITINDRLESAAESGVKEISLYVWNRTAKKLADAGIELTATDITGRKGEKYYNISWKNAIVEDLPDNWNLDTYLKEKGSELNQAQILWLMAEDAKKKN